MSDAAHDAVRPDNRPKGFGWWSEERQSAYCQKIWDRGDRDDWLVMRMLRLNLISDQTAREELSREQN